MELALRFASIICLVLALVRIRWAYVGFVVLALLSLPAQAGFHLVSPACELMVGPALALYSFHNTPHIILFALFFLLTRRQMSGPGASAWAAGATLLMGALLELSEGVSGSHHCRLRDLLPDAAGAALGWLALAAGQASWRRRAHRQAVA